MHLYWVDLRENFWELYWWRVQGSSYVNYTSFLILILWLSCCQSGSSGQTKAAVYFKNLKHTLWEEVKGNIMWDEREREIKCSILGISFIIWHFVCIRYQMIPFDILQHYFMSKVVECCTNCIRLWSILFVPFPFFPSPGKLFWSFVQPLIGYCNC